MTEDSIPESAKEVLYNNQLDVMENGPGLRYGMGICILAKNAQTKQVLLGGLGGMGIGQMWAIDNEDKKRFPGYDDAPEKPIGSYFNEFTQHWVESDEPW